MTTKQNIIFLMVLAIGWGVALCAAEYSLSKGGF